MWISLVTLIPTLIFLKDTEASLLEPVRQCVPTATVRGPCHTCVCGPEGVFHCRSQLCGDRTIGKTRPHEDCERNYVYREDNVFCTCGNDGYWLSENCELKFQYLLPRFRATHPHLRTNVVCTPNLLYIIDCNVCRCATTGFIDVTLCTNRYCVQGRKADSCSYGDVLRLDNQLCSCSDINYFIDRKCVKIDKSIVQILATDDIFKLIEVGNSPKQLKDLRTDICDAKMIFIVDCNQCVCDKTRLVCSKKDCSPKQALRYDSPLEKIDSLPELKSDGNKCIPGKKYRYKCNSCVCSPDGVPSCTTMVCLEEYVLDVKALRSVLSQI